jgi:carbon monoxide dehydrogenase subunit G
VTEAGPRESAVVHATPEEIWSTLTDPDALRRIIPAIESLDAEPSEPSEPSGLSETGQPARPARFSGVLAAKTFFLTIRADIVVELLEPDPPRHVLLSLSGRTRGMNGEFVVRAPLDFTALPDGSTRVDYSTDVQVSGQIASFGRSAGDAIRGQVSELVVNLEREIAGRRAR